MNCCSLCAARTTTKPLKGYIDVRACTACRIVLALEEAGTSAFDSGGSPDDCPFPAGTAQRGHWIDGWDHAAGFADRWSYEAELECVG